MKDVFKVSHLINGYGTTNELIADTLKDFIDNNYAIYGWNMKEPFLQMKRGDLLVLHSGLDLKYIGEVTLPPHEWKFHNPSNVPFLDSIDDKFATEGRDKWVMVCVKKWFKIEYLNINELNIGSAMRVSQKENQQKINDVYQWLSKI